MAHPRDARHPTIRSPKGCYEPAYLLLPPWTLLGHRKWTRFILWTLRLKVWLVERESALERRMHGASQVLPDVTVRCLCHSLVPSADTHGCSSSPKLLHSRSTTTCGVGTCFQPQALQSHGCGAEPSCRASYQPLPRLPRRLALDL